MSAKDASGARPPPNRNAGDSARVRVVATTISTWLAPGAFASDGTGTRKPSELAQPVRPRAMRPAKLVPREGGPRAGARLGQNCLPAASDLHKIPSSGQVGQCSGWEFEAMSQHGFQMLYWSPASGP